MLSLETNYAGLKLKNPIIVASSDLTDSVEKIKNIESNGGSAVVIKSLFEEEVIIEMEEAVHSMLSRPFVYPETFDYMEDEGNVEDATRKYLELIREAKKKVDIPIIGSINCVSSQKWTYFAKEIEKAGADALEFNMFFMPSDLNKDHENVEKLYFEIINKVKQIITIPIVLKISFYSSNLGRLINKLDKTGINGLVLFNRFYHVNYNIDTFEITNQSVLSNSNEYLLSLRWIACLSEHVNCSLAASTGVHTAETMIKMILAGADAVQIASVLYKKGVNYISELLQILKKWMKKHNFKSIDDFKGKMSQTKSNNPAAFDRLQFMKQFRNYISEI